MEPIKRVYLLIGIPLLLIAAIFFSPYRNWLAIQASEISEQIGDQIFFPIVFQKEGPTIIRIDDTVAGTGDIVQIMVEAINLDRMATTTMEFSFDPTVLSPLACNKDPDNQFDLAQCNLEFEEDTIRFNLTSLRAVSGDIRLAELAFEVIGESEDTSLIEIEVFTFASNLGESLEYSVQNGKFTVSIEPPPRQSDLSPYDLSQRIDVGPFVFHASDDMVEVDVQGIDSLVKVYKNVEMKISLDYGWYSGYSPHSSEITLTIDGFEAIYNTQAGYPESGYTYYSNILFEDFDPEDPYNRLGMGILSNREDAAEVALAIFNTINFDHEMGD